MFHGTRLLFALPISLSSITNTRAKVLDKKQYLVKGLLWPNYNNTCMKKFPQLRNKDTNVTKTLSEWIVSKCSPISKGLWWWIHINISKTFPNISGKNLHWSVLYFLKLIMPSVNLISFQTVKNGHTYYSTWKKITIKDKYTEPGMDLNLKYIKQDLLQVQCICVFRLI